MGFRVTTHVGNDMSFSLSRPEVVVLYFGQRFLDLVKFLRRGKSEMSGLIYLADAHQVRQPLLFYAVELIRLSSSVCLY